MTRETITAEELDRLPDAGEEIYARKLKAKLEPKHIGKIVVIEVESGKYFVGNNMDEAMDKAEAKFPDKVFYIKRIGFKTVMKKRW
jgi:hypothetical protein